MLKKNRRSRLRTEERGESNLEKMKIKKGRTDYEKVLLFSMIDPPIYYYIYDIKAFCYEKLEF